MISANSKAHASRGPGSNDLLDKSQGQRSLGIQLHLAIDETHIEGGTESSLERQVQVLTVTDEAALYVGVPKSGVDAGNDDVRFGDPMQPTADGPALDSGYHGLTNARVAVRLPDPSTGS